MNDKVSTQLDILSAAFTADEMRELGEALIAKANEIEVSKHDTPTISHKTYYNEEPHKSYEEEKLDYLNSAFSWALGPYD